MPTDVLAGSILRTSYCIVYADIFGYTALMEQSELETHILSNDAIRQAKALASRFGGLVAQDAIGDGLILLFEQASDAVFCGLGIQAQLQHAPLVLGNGELLLFRVAIHHGDVLVDKKKYTGKAINQAARMQSHAEPGGLLLSSAVYFQLPDSISSRFSEVEIPDLKNIKSLSRSYALAGNDQADHFDPQVTQTSNFSRLYQPRIAIVPTLSNSDDKSVDSDVVSELLTNLLSRFSDFKVTPPLQNTTHTRDRAVFLRMCRMDGIEYVLETTLVATSSSSSTLFCRIANTSENRIIWSKDYAGGRTNANAGQSLVLLAKRVAVAVWAVIRTYESRSNRTALSDNIVANSFYSARALVRSSDHQDIVEGLVRLEKIVEKKPDFHLAKIELAFAYQIAWRFDIHIDKTYTLDMAIRLMESVIADDPYNGEAHRELGYAQLFGRDNLAGIETMEKAVDLNPLDVMSISNLAEGFTFTNQGERALEFSQRSLAMESSISKDWRLWGFADAHFCARNYRGVVDTVNQMDDQSEGLRLKAASLANLNRLPEASAAKDAVLRKTPDFKVSKWRSKPPYTDVSETDHLCDGLLKAGFPA